MLLKEVKRRTGLTRRQLRYLEERALIGFVARSDDRRIFSERQGLMLETLARLRELGASRTKPGLGRRASRGHDLSS